MSTKSQQPAAQAATHAPKPVEPDSNQSVIEIVRTYAAPRDVVWEVMTDPQHVARWWGGPGVTNPVCEMDVRPGGQWHHVMRFPDGNEMHMDFVFLQVEEPHKLVWQQIATSHGGGPRDIVFSVTLKDLGDDQTESKLVAHFRSAADREIALAIGFSRPIEASNERMAEYLQTYNRGPRAAHGR